jgi:prolyl oligopeptidase
MKRTIIFLLFSHLFIGQLNYPKSKTMNQIDNYHGIEITDPYRWLEDEKSDETRAWIDAQESFTENYLKNLPIRNRIQSLLQKFNNTGRGFSIPIVAGNTYYFLSGKQGIPHPELFKQNGLSGEKELVYQFSDDYDRSVAFGNFIINPSGTFAAYVLRNRNTNAMKIHVFDLQKMKRLDYEISGTIYGNLKFRNETTFWYVGYGDVNENMNRGLLDQFNLKSHTVGKPNSDLRVYQTQRKEGRKFSIQLSEDQKFLIEHVFDSRSDQNQVAIVDLTTKHRTAIHTNAESMTTSIGSIDHFYYFYSNDDAPNGKIIRYDRRNQSIQTIVNETKYNLAGGSTAGGNAMGVVNDHLVVIYREIAINHVFVYDQNGELKTSKKLDAGWIGSGIVSNPNENAAWFTLTTFTNPTATIRVDLHSFEINEYFRRTLQFNPDDFITNNVMIESKDGKMVPMFICYKKGLERNGKNPVYMYAYGFGGWTAVPWYQSQMLTWLEMGGIYVMPGIRGGGEFGESWKNDGIRFNRHNAINDYIAAAEYMVKENYTSEGLIVANGWSASGHLPAIASIKRPKLFGAAMIGIPSLDMLRYQYFTNNTSWTNGFGSSGNKDEFENLMTWSPLHNIKPTQIYPPMMVTVGEIDPVTPPRHGYKFIATIQNSNQSNPMLLNVVRGEQHGFGTNTAQRNHTYTNELSFLWHVLKLDQTQF